VQCYTVGTHSRCLNTWEKPIGDMEGLFHKVKIIHTTRGKNKEREKEEIKIFYDKMTTLRWDPYRWRWVEGDRFLNYTTKLGRNFLTKRTEGVNHATNTWQCYLPRNYKSYWSQVCDPLRFGRKPVLCGQYGINICSQ
jgi:hypothetical protein